MNKSHWRKSANWFALTRRHAYTFVNETKLEPGWEGVTCCDEHYLPSILAYYGLDNETTCTDGLAHVNWLVHYPLLRHNEALSIIRLPSQAFTGSHAPQDLRP